MDDIQSIWSLNVLYISILRWQRVEQGRVLQLEKTGVKRLGFDLLVDAQPSSQRQHSSALIACILNPGSKLAMAREQAEAIARQ